MKKQIKFFYAKSIKEVEYQVNNWIRKYPSELINSITPFTDNSIYVICMVEYLIKDNSGGSEEKKDSIGE
jgi:hypothetical protein